MVSKKAIFDRETQKALLEECGETELIPVYLMLQGVHRHDVAFRSKFQFDGEFVVYKRCKTGEPRSIAVPYEYREKLADWLKNGRHRSPDALTQMVMRVGARIGHPEITPMTLRHSHALNTLRRYADKPYAIDMVAQSMGCSRKVLLRNYLDMEQVQSLADEKEPVEKSPIVVRSPQATNLKRSMGLVPASMLRFIAPKQTTTSA
jgi:hypothetical protein